MSERKFLGYPNPLASEAEKATKEYGLSYFKSMYRDWAGENDVLLESRRSRWQTARNYAGGKQSTAKYKDLMNVNGDQSYANLDWSVVPIIPKFVDIIVNSLTNADYHIKATAIDPVSTSKRLEDEMKIKTRMLTKDFLKEVEMLTGIPAQGINDYTPQSKEELELFMQLTYKQAAEIAIEQGLKLAMTINDWREVAKRVIRDLVVIGIGAVKTELDDRGVMIRYVDPLYLVTSYSENPDFTKITHAGEIRRISVRELKAEAGDQFTEKEYADIATRFAGKWGNAKQFRTVPNIVNGQEYYEYDHFLIDVMDGQFIVPNKLVYEEKENKYGGKTVNKKKENYKLPQKSKYNRSLMKVSYDCKYTGKMILGSDYLFDYGKAINQVRPKSALHKTKLDYIIYAPDIDFMKNQSLCERMIPFGDQIQLVHLKLQQLAAKARPKGLAMEVGSMEGVSDGKGGTFSTLDIQDIYEQTGNYYFRYINDDGSPSQARRTAESAILMIQDLVEYDRPYKGYVHAIGELNMTAIEVTKDVSLYEFGIILEAEPNEEDKAKLEENIQQSLAQKELRIEDAIMIRSVKNMKLANQLLILRRNRYIEQQMQQAQAQAQANAEQQAMAAQQKFEGDMKREQAMNQFKLEFLQNEMGLKDQFAQKEHMRKLEEIKLMNDGKIDVAQVNNEQKS
jgi:hypothetical protein